MTATTSIIIVTYNSASQIGACLDAVAELQPRGVYEVIVLDNASGDGTAELVREHFRHVKLIAEQENWGFAGGVNRAAEHATGDFVLLLNPDALPEPNWAHELVAALHEPSVGVVGSKVLEPDGRIQSLGSTLDPRTMLTAHRTEGANGRVFDVDAAHGAAMGFSKALWQQLGGFDEGFFPAYWEEVDFCRRALGAGYRVVVAPGAVIRHAEASSTGKYSAQFYGYYLRNRLRYAAKWLSWDKLWHEFRPAEHARLITAPMLDRRVARMVYDEGVPALDAPTASERSRIRELGAGLRNGMLPADSYGAILAQLQQAEDNSVHQEVEFTSRFASLARFRTAWNNVATRWYVRPNFDQQTRYNLATQRAIRAVLEQETGRAAASALDVALLSFRLRSEFGR